MTETGDLSIVPAKTREYRKDSIHRPLRRHLHGDSPYRFTHPQARFDKPLLAGSWYFGKEVRYRLVDLYEKMFARDLPCKMTVAISKPLTRQQAELLNERGTIVTLLLAGAFSVPLHPLSKPVARVVGVTVGLFTKNIIRSYHAGDVIVGSEAQVDGGIGPQRSMSAMVIQFQGGGRR